MNGITIINNDQLVDHHTAVHHNFPNCESYQNYKGVYNGKSHGVFNGKVFVDKIAQNQCLSAKQQCFVKRRSNNRYQTSVRNLCR